MAREDQLGTGTFRKESAYTEPLIERTRRLGISQGRIYRDSQQTAKKFLNFAGNSEKLTQKYASKLNVVDEQLEAIDPDIRRQNDSMRLSAQQMSLSDIGDKNFRKIKPKLSRFEGINY